MGNYDYEEKVKYTITHEWIRLEGNIATVGITNFAKIQLGEIVYIELPKLGQKITSQEPVCIIESSKSASEITAPLSGKVVAVNDALKGNIGLINNSPEKEGWLFKVQIEDEKEYDALMDTSSN